MRVVDTGQVGSLTGASLEALGQDAFDLYQYQGRIRDLRQGSLGRDLVGPVEMAAQAFVDPGTGRAVERGIA